MRESAAPLGKPARVDLRNGEDEAQRRQHREEVSQVAWLPGARLDTIDRHGNSASSSQFCCDLIDRRATQQVVVAPRDAEALQPPRERRAEALLDGHIQHRSRRGVEHARRQRALAAAWDAPQHDERPVPDEDTCEPRQRLGDAREARDRRCVGALDDLVELGARALA